MAANSMSKLAFLRETFQRRAVVLSGMRALCETEDGRFRSFQIGQPAPDGGEALLTPERSLLDWEIYDLSDRAGFLAARLIRSGRYKRDPEVLMPVWEGLRDFWKIEVWLRFLLHTHANNFRYSNGGSSDPSPVLFGEGKVIGWIDNYPQVCAEALAKLKASESVPLTTEPGLSVSAPSVPTPNQKGTQNKKTKGKNIDARMLKILSENREASGWTASVWALRLQCAESTVKGTKTWKERLKANRAEQAVEHARKMDRSRLVQANRHNGGLDGDETND